MGENNYLKIVYLVFFLALASVSCWATASSLRLLWPDFPAVFCWIVTIAFFFLASYGTMLIVKSFSKGWVENRYLKLFGGLLLFLVFWLAFSMPTNTHTFFYNLVVNDVYNQDEIRTVGYLNQISKNEGVERMLNMRIEKVKSGVNQKLDELEAEIKNSANPGFGPKAKKIFKDFADLLEVPSIEPLSYRGTSIQDMEKLKDAYRKKIYMLRDSKIAAMRNGMQKPSANSRKRAEIAMKNLELSSKYLREKKWDLKNPDDVGKVNEQLSLGYNIIKNNKDFIYWLSEKDEEHYTQENTVTDVKRLVSVFDVWKDFLAGKYQGSPFIYWIILSVLVDLGAFLFFDLLFKNRD